MQITDSNALPDIDWAGAEAPPAAAAAAAAAGIPAGYVPLDSDLEWPPRSNSGSAGGAAGAALGGSSAQWQPVTYSSAYTPSSQQTLQKHALFAPKNSSRPLQQQGSLGGSRPRYPAFDSTPLDALWNTTNSTAAGAAAGAAAAGAAAAAAAVPDISSLAVSQQQQQIQQPAPSAGPSLGPQEVEVQSMQPCAAQLDGSCAVAAVGLPSVAEAAAAAAAGPKLLSKRLDLRDVHISVALMNDFLHYAANNTRR